MLVTWPIGRLLWRWLSGRQLLKEIALGVSCYYTTFRGCHGSNYGFSVLGCDV
jgi:hypothetical protein